jgi:hypothetical protein
MANIYLNHRAHNIDVNLRYLEYLQETMHYSPIFSLVQILHNFWGGYETPHRWWRHPRINSISSVTWSSQQCFGHYGCDVRGVGQDIRFLPRFKVLPVLSQSRYVWFIGWGMLGVSHNRKHSHFFPELKRIPSQQNILTPASIHSHMFENPFTTYILTGKHT